MHTWRTHSAWLLLALLTLGGVVAPIMHQMQHDASHARAAVVVDLGVPLHSEFDHTMQGDTERPDAHAFYCLLCHTHLMSELVRQVAVPTPLLEAAALGITSSFVRAVAHLAPSLIRGPPAAA